MKDNFKNNVNNAFDQVEDNFNPDLIWQGITDKMEPKKEKKKRPFFFWFFGAGVGAFLLIASLFFFNGFEINKHSFISNKTTDSAIQLKSKEKASIESDFPTSHTPDTFEDLQEREETISNEELKIAGIQFDQNGIRKANLISESILVEEKKGKPNILNNETTNSLNNETTISITNVLQNRNESLFSNVQQSNLSIKKEGLIQKRNELKQDIFSTREINKVGLLSSRIISKFPLNHLLNNSAEKINSIRFIVIEKEKQKNLGKTIELYGGISFGSKESTSSNSEYIAIRNEYERLLEQLTFGARAQIFKINNLSFWAGAQGLIITDYWESQYNYTEDMPFTYTASTTENLDGSVDNQMITEIVPFEVDRSVKQFNSEQILSFPLIAKYQKDFNRFNLAASLGVEFNYLFGSEHKVIGLDGFPVIDKKRSQWLAPSLAMRLSAGYSISPNWDIVAGINYRSLVISNSTIIPDLQSKYTLLGIEMGIAKRF